MVEIPGVDASALHRAHGGVRGARPGASGAAGRARAGAESAANAVDGDQPDLSAVARRHLSEGAARLHDVAASAPITDADHARATVRDLVRSLREEPQGAESAQANVPAATVARLLQG